MHILKLGPTRQFLGIDIQRHADGSISLGQPAHFKLTLKRFRMEDAQPVSTPLDPQIKLDGIAETRAETALDDKGTKLYQAIIGSLIRVLRYLKATADYRLHHRKSINGCLIGFTDWVGDNADRSLKADTSSVETASAPSHDNHESKI